MTSKPDKPLLKIKAQVMSGDDIAIGPGKADLLQAVAETGSIAAAGRKLGLSYRRTRDMIDTLNASWRVPGLLDRPQRDSELEQMVFQKEDGQWRIVTGF